jgi:hypothetical protein
MRNLTFTSNLFFTVPIRASVEQAVVQFSSNSHVVCRASKAILRFRLVCQPAKAQAAVSFRKGQTKRRGIDFVCVSACACIVYIGVR